jgi:hypothetical protein
MYAAPFVFLMRKRKNLLKLDFDLVSRALVFRRAIHAPFTQNLSRHMSEEDQVGSQIRLSPDKGNGLEEKRAG